MTVETGQSGRSQGPGCAPPPAARNPREIGSSVQTRLQRLACLSPSSRRLVDDLLAVAGLGLPRMHKDGVFAHTMRFRDASPRGTGRQGDNLRYAAMVALGLSKADEGIQRQVLGFGTAAFVHFAPQFVVAAPAEDDQRDIEEKCIDEKAIRTVALARPGVENLRDDRTAGAHEQQHGCGRDAQCDEIPLGTSQMAPGLGYWRFIMHEFMAPFAPGETLWRIRPEILVKHLRTIPVRRLARWRRAAFAVKRGGERKGEPRSWHDVSG